MQLKLKKKEEAPAAAPQLSQRRLQEQLRLLPCLQHHRAASPLSFVAQQCT